MNADNRKSEELKFEKKLDAYLRGDLSPEEVDQLWISFMKHPELYEHFETELAFLQLMQEKGGSQDRPRAQESGTFTRYKLLGIAAAILLFLGLWWSYEHMATNDTAYVSDQIAVTQLESVPVNRSASASNDQLYTRLNTGLEAALSDRTDEALNIFSELADAGMPEVSLTASLNRGILLYNQMNYTEALGAFDHVIYSTDKENMSEKVNLVQEKARWFKAHVLLKNGQTEAAKNELKHVVEASGVFKKQAQQVLNKLND